MRSNSLTIALLLVTWSSLVSAQAPDLESMDIVLRSVPDGPVAKVFGENISRDQFVRFYRSELKRITAGDPVPSRVRVELGTWCLKRLVEQEMLYREGINRNVEIKRAEVVQAWNDQRDAIRESLRATGSGDLSDEELLARIGFSSRDEALAEVERALVIVATRKQLIEESDVEVDDSEVNEFYESVKDRLARPDIIHLHQIFVGADPGDSRSAKTQRQDARRRAEDALAHIDAGQSFDAVVRSVSDAPDKAVGGDMGAMPIEKLPPFLVDAALKLEIGEVSDVLESEFGFHIVKLHALEAGSDSSLDRVRPAIEDRLLAKEGELFVREYLNNQIKQPEDVQVFLELERNLSLHPEYREMTED